MINQPKPFTKPFVSIDPPVVEDKLGGALFKQNDRSLDPSTDIDSNKYRYKKHRIGRNSQNRRSMETVKHRSCRKLCVKPIYWSKTKCKLLKEPKINTKEIGLFIKPPLSDFRSTQLMFNKGLSPNKPSILEQSRQNRESAPTLSSLYSSPFSLRGKFSFKTNDCRGRKHQTD